MARLDQDTINLTPTQQKLWNALEDGKPHPRKELAKLIDEQCDLNNLAAQMSYLRTKMRQKGAETVICENGCYRRVEYKDPFGPPS